jgi:ssRNA-specific RNase YbeY (16S rRNA maturation enzyme)
MPRRPVAGLHVEVCDAQGRPAAALARGLAPWLQRIAPASARGILTLALVSDARIRTLNRDYRGKDYATDVLSFPAEEDAASDVRIKRGKGISPAHSSAPSSDGGGASLRRVPAGERGTSLRASAEVGASRRSGNGRGASGGFRIGDSTHLGDVVIATGVAGRQAREAGHSLGTELRVLALHGLLHLLGYDHERDRGEMARVERRLRRRGGLREGLIERAV